MPSDAATHAARLPAPEGGHTPRAAAPTPRTHSGFRQGDLLDQGPSNLRAHQLGHVLQRRPAQAPGQKPTRALKTTAALFEPRTPALSACNVPALSAGQVLSAPRETT